MRVDDQGRPLAREFSTVGLTQEQRKEEAESIGPIVTPDRVSALIAAITGLENVGLDKAREVVTENATKRQLKNLHRYFDKLEELAEGVFYEQETRRPNGTVTRKIYREKPDRQALIYLVDRLLGSITKISEQKVQSSSEVKILSVNLHGSTPNTKPSVDDARPSLERPLGGRHDAGQLDPV